MIPQWHRTESGAYVGTTDAEGCAVRIVTGYSIETDNYPVHIYLTKGTETAVVADGKMRHPSEAQAMEWGTTKAEAAITSPLTRWRPT